METTIEYEAAADLADKADSMAHDVANGYEADPGVAAVLALASIACSLAILTGLALDERDRRDDHATD